MPSCDQNETLGTAPTRAEDAERHPMTAVEAAPSGDYPRLRVVNVNNARS